MKVDYRSRRYHQDESSCYFPLPLPLLLFLLLPSLIIIKVHVNYPAFLSCAYFVTRERYSYSSYFVFLPPSFLAPPPLPSFFFLTRHLFIFIYSFYIFIYLYIYIFIYLYIYIFIYLYIYIFIYLYIYIFIYLYIYIFIYLYIYIFIYLGFFCFLITIIGISKSEYRSILK